MDRLSEAAARILDLEARQDDVLRQLEELERQVEAVLAQHLPQTVAAPSQNLLPPAKSVKSAA